MVIIFFAHNSTRASHNHFFMTSFLSMAMALFQLVSVMGICCILINWFQIQAKRFLLCGTIKLELIKVLSELAHALCNLYTPTYTNDKGFPLGLAES